MSIRHMGVLLSVDEVVDMYHLLLRLSGDDLILEESRLNALETFERLFLDLYFMRQDSSQSSVSQSSLTEQ